MRYCCHFKSRHWLSVPMVSIVPDCPKCNPPTDTCKLTDTQLTSVENDAHHKNADDGSRRKIPCSSFNLSQDPQSAPVSSGVIFNTETGYSVCLQLILIMSLLLFNWLIPSLKHPRNKKYWTIDTWWLVLFCMHHFQIAHNFHMGCFFYWPLSIFF